MCLRKMRNMSYYHFKECLIQHYMQQDMHEDFCHIKETENMLNVLVFGFKHLGFGRDLNKYEVMVDC